MIDRFNTGWGSWESIYRAQMPSVRKSYLDGFESGSAIGAAIYSMIKEQKRMQKEINMRNSSIMSEYYAVYKKFEYKKIIFNPPATIVLWRDGTKTVVKCSERDKFDKEKGIALCFMKKALWNTSGALNKILHKEVRE